jgi:hypothetical protein
LLATTVGEGDAGEPEQARAIRNDDVESSGQSQVPFVSHTNKMLRERKCSIRLN